MHQAAIRYDGTAKILVLCICLAVLIAPAAAGAKGDKLRRFELGDLIEILKSEGYGGVEPEENRIIFKADGRKHALVLYPEGDLLLYYGITGVTVTSEDLNAWNRERRLSRAYLDESKDPVLEADLLANAGINRQMVVEFVKVFVDSVSVFRNFIIEHDRGEPTPAKPAPTGAGI